MDTSSGVYRVASAAVEGNTLRVRFTDEKEGFIPLSDLAPRQGKPDWSRVSIRLKGAHLAVPVSAGEFPEHEIPWDVLRAHIDPEFQVSAHPAHEELGER